MFAVTYLTHVFWEPGSRRCDSQGFGAIQSEAIYVRCTAVVQLFEILYTREIMPQIRYRTESDAADASLALLRQAPFPRVTSQYGWRSDVADHFQAATHMARALS
jgi:hypothetical protein